MDLDTHLEALLHDCDEDTHLMTAERITSIFGKKIGQGVKVLSKNNLENKEKKEREILKSAF